ncbi:MAG: hypothetical protein ND807_07575 [Vicinamibacterales bacterium]|nr:hypothetical protein [Vicinamibacterales bacterium]
MAPSKGIQRYPIFKLGKAKARRDSRNLKLKAILRVPVEVPKEYDFDTSHAGVPTPVFANDRFGDCVIAGRAHQTLRFELLEQKKIIRITDTDVVQEYFRETGGADDGLVVLDSLKRWRKQGWKAAGDKYFITAFAEIDRKSASEVKRTVFTDLGAGLGLSLPLTAQREFAAGKAWNKTTGSGSTRNSWGGHYVYVCGYTTLGPMCVTWGRKQQMSWAFFKKYCDEAYAVIDALNTRKKRLALNGTKIAAFLSKVTAVAKA